MVAIPNDSTAQFIEPNVVWYRPQTAGLAMAQVFRAWRIDRADAAKLAGASQRTWSRVKAGSWSGEFSVDQLQRAYAIVGVYNRLHVCFRQDIADTWVRTPNRHQLFGGGAPIHYMIEGGLLAVVETRCHVDGISNGFTNANFLWD